MNRWHRDSTVPDIHHKGLTLDNNIIPTVARSGGNGYTLQQNSIEQRMRVNISPCPKRHEGKGTVKTPQTINALTNQSIQKVSKTIYNLQIETNERTGGVNRLLEKLK